ncbi:MULTISPECIES: hypothetical protein [unclassified Streptomyces]|uniref:hypothetical protein n=1 Tax=unclassified Streptomyces TaxID=2593676 RepID=UPI002250165D|nr:MULTISPECIES: hypothetical protein [unclassified Streptomyces]MCX5443238.1 hypothetical protein [Streptomyces sp. NBC_00063]WSE12389.1 hypothetical protein OG518_03160 [Streptomyces sp. NBC_01397]WSE19240.1 hypothetical protein OG518_41290 [Streptomyces sp. NBC_01397]WUB98651.1 hypothetical protein OHO83_43625 [Streptomyces sp. NBC_00569]
MIVLTFTLVSAIVALSERGRHHKMFGSVVGIAGIAGIAGPLPSGVFTDQLS